MGVPKFFRWISERYPKINQRYGSPPNPDTAQQYFDQQPILDGLEKPDPLSTCGLPPEIDRLYLDMNGIIHGCSHNNSDQGSGGRGDVAGQEEPIDGANGSDSRGGTYQVSNEEIFRNVCYYLDRVIGDMVQPKQLVYMAIDGVAPRAKMNQQRSRRYRSGREGEIETSIYEAHALTLKEEEIMLQREQEEEVAFEQKIYHRKQEEDNFNFVFDIDEGNRPSSSPSDDAENDQVHLQPKSLPDDRYSKPTTRSDVEEIAPGRFKGKFETHLDDDSGMDDEAFHSNAITPGTPFFTEFTKHLEHFVKYKLSTDPKWKDLTIIFSGPNVPGEGEHKIMQFIREQRNRSDYDPNLRHCIMGQDGDLIMLGLCTHEPNMVLLRERVIFNAAQQRLEEAKAENMLDTYIHNSHFEFLHMGVLRDYLAYEFETSNVISDSPWDLERTIDDFVFMTFLVGNDFLPHLPAIDIADNAFDLLFWTYKKCRAKWVKRSLGADAVENLPYLTYAGKIVSGKRLEEFLSAVGSHEIAYYDKKKQSAETESKRLRKQYKKMGMEGTHLPNDSLVASKEASDRAAYRKMLQDVGDSALESQETLREITDSFQPVMSGKVEFQPVEEEIEEGLISRMGSLLQNSLSSSDGRGDEATKYQLASLDDQDLKGRYYYDKFQFTPFDADKHLALRRAYMEGLVWNLAYYYEGCISWEWYYPYHYGPMLSDLVNLDEILDEISFEDKGAPLAPFEQLLGCMPPSQAHHLPAPYRWLMTDPQSPIIDFYPKSFTVDMNGKRWPWEAVVLLPFIDSKRLLEATATVDQALLSHEERERNAEGRAVVMVHDPSREGVVPGLGNLRCFQRIDTCRAVSLPFDISDWKGTTDKPVVLKPNIKEGTEYPLPGFSSLRTAPVQCLWRRKMGLNIFGGRSRYKTATLEISSLMPPLPPVELLGPKLIGTTVYINYPHFVEALVTAVSDQRITVRGKNEPRKWSQEETSRWKFQRDGMIRQAEIGEGYTGTGGLVLPSDEAMTLSVRPFERLLTMRDGTMTKTYARFEVQIPLISTLWSPAKLDPRLANVPSRLEKNPYEIFLKQDVESSSGRKSNSPKEKIGNRRRKLFPSKKRLSKDSSFRGEGVDMNGRSKISSAFYSTDCSTSLFSREVDVSGIYTTARLQSGVQNHLCTLTALNHGQPWKGFTPPHTRLLPSNPADGLLVGQRRLHASVPSPRIAGSKGRLMAATIVAFSFLFGVAKSAEGALHQRRSDPMKLRNSEITRAVDQSIKIRGGDFEAQGDISGVHLNSPTPPLEFAHGTTTLSFSFQGGIVVAVDSRASMGSFVGSKTVQKVLPISTHVLGTMAGGAADCQFWIRKVKAEALLHELKEDGKKMSVARISRTLSNYLYEMRPFQLSVGTMIAGWDAKGPQIFYVDSTGLRLQGDLFAVGSGSTFALGILDSQENRHELSADDAIALGIRAIRHATFRDAYSGGFINVYLITPEDGWKKVYTEDIARSPEIWRNRRDEKMSGAISDAEQK